MSNRMSRSSWLIIFAVCNLAFWVAVAVAVGLIVSDEVDLGVETLIRERQATAVVVWEHIVKTSEAIARPAAATQTPMPVKTEAVKYRPTPVTNAVSADTPSPSTRAQPREDLTLPSTPTALPEPEQPVAQPEEMLLSSPLLMSDLGSSSLMRMDSEMSRSAEGRAVQIKFSEAALNHEIEMLLENNPDLPYDNVHVDLKRDQVVLTGDVTVLRFQVGTEVVGTVVAEDCMPHMQIQSMSIAGVLTPGFVKDQIRRLILEALNWYPPDYPLCLEQIVLEEDRAMVYGHRR
jgi:hypothetical protein